MIEEPGPLHTPRQAQALQAVRQHLAAHGRPPALKEIVAEIGGAPSYAYQLIRALVRLGFVRLEHQRARRTLILLTSRLGNVSSAELEAELAGRAARLVQAKRLPRT